jgi:V-type H+-transporting ATPase subunit E
MKFKQAAMAQQIAASNITNKSRLKVLNARQQVLDDIFEDARSALPEIQKNKEKYAVLLKNLILEVCSLRKVLMTGNVWDYG